MIKLRYRYILKQKTQMHLNVHMSIQLIGIIKQEDLDYLLKVLVLPSIIMFIIQTKMVGLVGIVVETTSLISLMIGTYIPISTVWRLMQQEDKLILIII